MTPFEKLKKKCLLLALDDEFDLFYLVSNIGYIYFHNKKIIDEEVNKITIDLIKYFFDKKLFTISGDVNGIELSNVSENECLSIIKSILDKDESSSFWIVFNLTKEGITEAKNYLLKSIHSEEKILINGRKRYQSIHSILNIVKQEFNTDDFDEIRYVAIKSLYSLIDSDFIKPGYLKDNIYFISWDYRPCESIDRIRSELEKFNSITETHEVFWFQNTTPTNILIDISQKTGNRLINDWYYFIDNL